MLKQIEKGVEVWSETVLLPTYPVGEPDKNPMFFEKRVYQGSSGKVYPHSVIDKIYDEKVEKAYTAVCLENKYLYVMILPELGGRIQRAYDKTNGYDFIYYNHVIKPALVGLTGPWISGGIEFNWPQHHRPSTFDPVDWRMRENEDGSCTVLVGEIENMFRTKGMACITLYPDKAYIEIKGQLYNRTDVPQTFLWWANPAVAVNDHTQSVFPPDVHAVMDHGKRDVSRFPIATGVYYKQDYSAGVDISRYKNIPVPTSYMAYHSDYDFVGGYDHEKKAGILHVADHHISPGKKQWTWGCGDFGQAWDDNLTDEDGPYIELMTGCFTDNQPDFTWMAPYEEKEFVQYFMPYKEAGMIKNATADAAVSLTEKEGEAEFVVYASGEFPGARVEVKRDGQIIYEKKGNLSPVEVWKESIPLEGACLTSLTLTVYGASGRELVSYTPQPEKIERMPEPAKAAPDPKEVMTNEDLFLYGLHIEQYRHATYLAEDYYEEGLRRDPTDSRINNAYGLLLMRRGLFAEAEKYFRAAWKKLTRSNPNPYDGEPVYNLGLCLKLQGKIQEAYDCFYKATWNGAWQDGGFYHMACICAQWGEYRQALEHVERSLVRNLHNMKARTLKAALLERLGRGEEAAAFAKESLEIDYMDYGARYVLGGETRRELLERSGKNPNWAIELALEFSDAGFRKEANEILLSAKKGDKTYPLIYYYAAANEEAMDGEKAAFYREMAAKACGDYCFPHRMEDVIVLQKALDANPSDSRGWYYLGNLWYDKRQYDRAAACWETCAKKEESFPTAHRNLALAYYNKLGKKEEARRELETAFALNPEDARVFMERDQLYKKLGVDPKYRLEEYEKHKSLVEFRDELFLEYVTLHNYFGENQKALDLVLGHKFHPWEGGEGKVPAQYVTALTELAKTALKEGRPGEAETLLQRALSYPRSLGEGKLAGAKDNNIYYYLGQAKRQMGEEHAAKEYFELATLGTREPAGMMYYNDQPPEMIFYQGLALEALGRREEALGRFNGLISFGEKHLFDEVKIEYFAVSLPDMMIFEEDLNQRNKVHCLFMLALGHMGKKEMGQAEKYMKQAAALDKTHMGIRIHMPLLEERETV